jgi:hypothetical protein
MNWRVLARKVFGASMVASLLGLGACVTAPEADSASGESAAAEEVVARGAVADLLLQGASARDPQAFHAIEDASGSSFVTAAREACACVGAASAEPSGPRRGTAAWEEEAAPVL